MQHVVSIAFDFDDSRITKISEEALEKRVDEIIKEAILDRIAPTFNNYYSNRKDRDWSVLDRKIEHYTKQYLDEHKEQIIEKAASRIARSLYKSKGLMEKIDGI